MLNDKTKKKLEEINEFDYDKYDITNNLNY